ncbi:hypothetical protein Q8791_23170 [Nocardiopsis sp. CT-R113]|uniref:HTH cro/C1-type domain-containing protein n=1 Tax=Nocardiopsis codii TaxID=3065942 RepID=A0ABU7KD09_9ACTN|nr:hypothetical protein [Nocardiopsis sp. CT-R113]MEE2040123.1 hypothetical protein [Nocardiopsis sp. CT-R113]
MLDHITHLRKGGWSVAQIADAAGTSPSGLYKLINGDVGRVRTKTAAALLALSGPPPLSQSVSKRPIFGAQRRVRALIALGWSQRAIAERSGLSVEVMYLVRRGGRAMITSTTHHAIAQAYQELSRAAPENPSAAMVQLAKAEGWPPPAGWDDEWLDLPEAELAAELARLVGLMDTDEKRDCKTAFEVHKDMSPLVVAAARTYRRELRTKVEVAA